jgi:peptidoglycan-associated lipoprotein
MLRPAVVCLAFLAVAAGCAKQPGLTQASAPAPTGTASAREALTARRGGATTGPAARMAAGRPTAGGGATAEAAPARPPASDYVDVPDLQDIHFEFDRYDLRPGARLVLDGHAAWLRKHAGTLLLVEGHCDERGTAEYNITLGERRAKATANYLVSRGIASHRITIVSYGEERPVCRDSGEECWSRNRRAHFRVKEQ